MIAKLTGNAETPFRQTVEMFQQSSDQSFDPLPLSPKNSSRCSKIWLNPWARSMDANLHKGLFMHFATGQWMWEGANGGLG
jgi:hypothetical protein